MGTRKKTSGYRVVTLQSEPSPVGGGIVSVKVTQDELPGWQGGLVPLRVESIEPFKAERCVLIKGSKVMGQRIGAPRPAPKKSKKQLVFEATQERLRRMAKETPAERRKRMLEEALLRER